MRVSENIQEIKNEIPSHVRLVAISKTRPVSDIQEAYDGGQRIFGENKVQEMVPKHDALPDDIEWHMVGHLQSNKVKYIAPFVALIHSVDSLGLLTEINKQALKNNRVIPCLLQMHIAEEETKFGFSEEELMELFVSAEFHSLKNISVAGLMGMATFTSSETQVRNEFKRLVAMFRKLQTGIFSGKSSFRELSMGMSSDYQIAIEEGSTLIRVGTKIFGERDYSK